MSTIEETLKSGKKQIVIHKGNPTRLLSDFSAQTWQNKKEWYNIFKVLKGQKPTCKNTLLGKVIQNRRREFPRVKGVQQHLGDSVIKHPPSAQAVIPGSWD